MKILEKILRLIIGVALVIAMLPTLILLGVIMMILVPVAIIMSALGIEINNKKEE